MHPKNPFIQSYDFDLLVQHEPALKDFVFKNKYGTETIPFSDQKAVKSLNRALLKSHYSIEWDIPAQNLCPPIPGRLDYLLHVADLIKKPSVKLLDIGTGANSDLPNSGYLPSSWQCVASEVDVNSLANAQKIIDKNPLLGTIELRPQKSDRAILEHIVLPDDQLDVVVCNPPFFKNAEEAQQKNQRKVSNLNLKDKQKLNFGGLSNELWCKGGEEAFVIKMITESTRFQNNVGWFTSLVSNKDNLRNITRVLNKVNRKTLK